MRSWESVRRCANGRQGLPRSHGHGRIMRWTPPAASMLPGWVVETPNMGEVRDAAYHDRPGSRQERVSGARRRRAGPREGRRASGAIACWLAWDAGPSTEVGPIRRAVRDLIKASGPGRIRRSHGSQQPRTPCQDASKQPLHGGRRPWMDHPKEELRAKRVSVRLRSRCAGSMPESPRRWHSDRSRRRSTGQPQARPGNTRPEWGMTAIDRGRLPGHPWVPDGARHTG
jgi:hypothetical protein